MMETISKDGRNHEYPIEDMQIYEDYLHYKRDYINHHYYRKVEYHLFPKENIGIYVLTQDSNIEICDSKIYKYYVDMVSVKKNQEQWIIKDLYLDFIIKCNRDYYVVDVDEFNDAIKTMELSKEDIANALSGLDNILKGYYKSYDINGYIDSLIEIYSKERYKIFGNSRRLNYGT
jgi:hypothetical protein